MDQNGRRMSIVEDALQFDTLFKLLMVGNSAVGKSSIVKRYVSGRFLQELAPSLGVDLDTVTIETRKQNVKLQIWDTAGQERFRSLSTSFYRMGMGFILAYDITSEASFLAVNNWLTHIKNYGGRKTHTILLGNKNDLSKDREVPYKRGRELAESQGISFFETSAKTGENVNAVFEHMVDLLLDDTEAMLEYSYTRSGTYKLKQGEKVTPVAGKQKCAC